MRVSPLRRPRAHFSEHTYTHTHTSTHAHTRSLAEPSSVPCWAGSPAGGAQSSPCALLRGLYVAGQASNKAAEFRYFSLRGLRIFFYDLMRRQNACSLNVSL